MTNVATDEIAVRTEDVWKIYPQEPEDVQAVRGVSLEVREGDFMTMAGPSGSGKTTLLNMLGGLTRPTRGRIWVRDLEITELSNKELARLRLESIGFVFQAFNLLPVLSALENAEFSLLLRGVPAKERHQRVHALFEEWLSAFAPLKAGRVMRLVRDMRGGKAYDSRFGARQTGSGAYAEMIAARFEAAIRRYGLNGEESQLDCSRFRVPTDQLSLF